ncbi:hypothetical protein GCM10010937_01270 [Gluconobacter japonicus]|uniref:Uncharacterized protein n=1 Tax=Gluconobacter japonicus TaxID=376620 RepID=A0ABQ5WE17_GLUJA|nr:hypothetical protein AA3271_2750 [Gluconobacter japonicus NBRC 3271]GLQ58326.1 hypothetical protein GCM10010937_01270 [Gluconobacter japonicus]
MAELVIEWQTDAVAVQNGEDRRADRKALIERIFRYIDGALGEAAPYMDLSGIEAGK